MHASTITQHQLVWRCSLATIVRITSGNSLQDSRAKQKCHFAVHLKSKITGGAPMTVLCAPKIWLSSVSQSLRNWGSFSPHPGNLGWKNVSNLPVFTAAPQQTYVRDCDLGWAWNRDSYISPTPRSPTVYRDAKFCPEFRPQIRR